MKKLLTIAFMMMFATSIFAQDAPAPAPEEEITKEPFNQVTIWDFVFGVGYNYRKFHKVKLYKASDLPSYFYVPKTRGGGNGNGNGNGNGDPAGIPGQYDPNQPAWHDGEEMYEKPVHIGNADFGARDSSGVELNIGIPCFRHDALRIDALFGFMYYDCDTKIHTQTAQTEYEMQLHTYDIGAKATYKITDRMTASLSLGPSFNFSSLDTSSNGHRSDKDSLDMGVFASAGVQYWFTNYIGVGAEVRYDKVFNDVSTRYSDLDLDTWNTDLKFLFRF